MNHPKVFATWCESLLEGDSQPQSNYSDTRLKTGRMVRIGALSISRLCVYFIR
jgi:hypothetical protein